MKTASVHHQHVGPELLEPVPIAHLAGVVLQKVENLQIVRRVANDALEVLEDEQRDVPPVVQRRLAAETGAPPRRQHDLASLSTPPPPRLLMNQGAYWSGWGSGEAASA